MTQDDAILSRNGVRTEGDGRAHRRGFIFYDNPHLIG